MTHRNPRKLRTGLRRCLTAAVAVIGTGLLTVTPVAAPSLHSPPPVTLVAADAPWLSLPLLTVDVDQIVDRLGVGGLTISDILDRTGLADESLATLTGHLLDAAGLGNASVLELLSPPPDLTLGDALTQLVNTVFGNDVTVTEMISQLGGGAMTVGDLATFGLDLLGIGNKTVVDLVDRGPAGGLTVEQLILAVLQQGGDQTPAQLLAADPSLAGTTLGEVVRGLPPTDNTTGYSSLADEPMTDFLASDTVGGIGLRTIRQLGDIPGGIAGAAQCAVVAAMGLSCANTLNFYLGPNTVLQTMQGLTTSSNSTVDPSVHAGTPLSDITVANLLNGTGSFATMPLSQLVTGLHLATPTVSTLLTDLGFADKTIASLLADSFPSLFHKPVLSVLDAWGLGTLPVDTVIDRLHLDVPVVTLLDRLGLGDVPVDSVLNDLLGSVTVGNVVDDLGFGGTDIDTLVNDLGVGDTALFTVVLQFTGLLPSLVVGLPD